MRGGPVGHLLKDEFGIHVDGRSAVLRDEEECASSEVIGSK